MFGIFFLKINTPTKGNLHVENKIKNFVCFLKFSSCLFLSRVGASSSTAAVPSMWTLGRYISHPSLVIYVLFCNPTHKTKIGTAKGERLLIANHSDKSLWWATQEKQQLDHKYYTLTVDFLHSILLSTAGDALSYSIVLGIHYFQNQQVFPPMFPPNLVYERIALTGKLPFHTCLGIT